MKKEPKLIVLSFSGGKQSSALLWGVIKGLIPVDKSKFVVINADPGMENSFTYLYVSMMEKECTKANIPFYRVSNGNLYQDIINLSSTNKHRIDNPPYWTKNKQTGKKGRLRQSCTTKYKIIPIDRKIRELLDERYGISVKAKRIGNDIVEKWIGFTYDEVQRIKPSLTKYAYFTYPLIDLKWDRNSVIKFFKDNSLPIPPRSVCNACFANGLSTFKEMFDNRPNDWEQAIRVDNSIRDWSQIKIRDEVYVSSTLIPLKNLPDMNFDVSQVNTDLEEDYSCDSGYCFV